MIYIDEKLCTGCGLCADACPQRAIKFVAGVAVLDAGLCAECEACIGVCPNGAIFSVTEPRQMLPRSSALQDSAKARSAVLLRKQILPAVGSGLAFVGRSVVPFIADMTLQALERRANRPATREAGSVNDSSTRRPQHGGGWVRRRRRRRGGE